MSAALTNRRAWIAGTAATVAGTLLAACAPSAPRAPAPPVVLVHGAWMGAWVWDRVAAELRARGHAVTVVELPGHGADTTPPERLTLDGYAKAVLDALPAGTPAVLVGHSMAGMVISLVGERAPERIARLVYVAAYLPRSGESLYKLSMTDADSRVPRYWTQADPARYTPATIRADGIADAFCADCSADDLAALVARHKPEAIAPLGTPVTLSAANWGRLPKLYVHTLRDHAVSHRLQQAMVAAAGPGIATATLDSAHSPMLTQPRALAELISRPAP